jgi:hypothetical protein
MAKSRFLRRNSGKISFFGGGIITTSVNVAELLELIVFEGRSITTLAEL